MAKAPEEEAVTPDQRFYALDPSKLESLQKDKPWMKDPKYFTSVAVSPSAIMKMVMHCARGVEKGIAQGGNPTEVMGLLLGRPDPTSPRTLIVTDAFPLPIEGFETRVIADDQDVVNHMISLNESLENSRKEKFMGWYHSHPFDLGDLSHCFLSQTDLSTQLQWQRAEDPHGNPFVAMVLDPLRSTHFGTPEIKAFRAYPPEYQSPIAFSCPDGSVEANEQARLQVWGSCWNRYYELGVEYYMSSTSRSVLNSLTQDYLWISTLKQDSKTKPGVLKQLEKAVDQSKQAPSTTSIAATGASSAMMIDTTEATQRATASAISSTTAASENNPTNPAQEGLDSLVQTLSLAATQELAHATKKQVQQSIFAKP